MRKVIDLPGEDVLPPGALRSLTEALHQLYVGAGRPGAGQISNAIKQDDDRYPALISDERIRQLLRGEGGIASWLRYLSVVRYLAGHHMPALDGPEQELRFKRLYDAVVAASSGPGERVPLEGPHPGETTAHLAYSPTSAPRPRQPQEARETGSATSAVPGLDLLRDTLRAHGGLPLHVVEGAARGLCTELQNAARAIITGVELPSGVKVDVKFMDGKPDTSYGGLPYQPARTYQLGLTLLLSMEQPFAIRSVAGMLPGIATHRDNDQTFIVVDPTRPDVAPLFLHITDLHPEPTDEARQRIRDWVNGQVNRLFTAAATSYRAVSEARGYCDPAS